MKTIQETSETKQEKRMNNVCYSVDLKSYFQCYGEWYLCEFYDPTLKFVSYIIDMLRMDS